MAPILCPLLWISCLFAGAQPEGGSFLYQPAYSLDDLLRGPAEPCLPQPGDLFFATNQSVVIRIGHLLAGAGALQHSGLVVARPDGSLALLEAGPFDTVQVYVSDLLPQLGRYAQHEKVWIRRRRTPLTDEQSAALTAFAMAQEGKPFATLRLLGQLTPFRSRGPWRTRFLGGPHGDRPNYFCSELVMECCVAAGLIDPAVARPAATYPRDLFFDRSPNPYLNQTLNLSSCWYPPARWTASP